MRVPQCARPGSACREEVLAAWTAACTLQGLECSQPFSLSRILGDEALAREWAAHGLPADAFSVDGALIMTHAERWPLLVDPEGQARAWIRSLEATSNLVVVKLTDDGYVRNLENALQFGLPVLIEDVADALDSILDPILLRATFEHEGRTSVQLGSSVLEWTESFKLYMTTQSRNPRLAPEQAAKVTVINFAATEAGLEAQLLDLAVRVDRPSLHEDKARLAAQGANALSTAQ